MTDIVDQANERAAELLHDALARRQRQRAAAAAQQPEHSALECQACGEPISPARRLAVPGVQYCVTCQQRLEKGFLP